MVFGPFDYRPNVNIPADVFAPLANRYSGGYNAFTGEYDKAQQKAMERLKQNKWQQAISELMQNPEVPQQAKNFGPLIAANPELAGQLLPSLLRMGGQSTSAATPQQALDFLGDTPGNRKFLSDFQGNIPWSVLKSQRTAGLQTEAVGERKKLGDALAERSRAYKINTIYNQLNQLSASSGNVLGSAAMIQFRGQRGLDLLNSKEIKTDPTVYGLVRSDLAAIAQGGAPTIVAQAEAAMPTLRAQSQSLLQRLTARPEDVNQPDIKKQLNSIFRVMMQASSSVLEQNTGAVRAFWSRDPEATQMINEAVKYIGSGVKPENPTTMPALPAMPGVPTFGNDSGDDVQELLRTANQ